MPNAARRPDVDDLPGPVIAAVTFNEQGRHCLRQALQRAAHTGQPVIALHILHETERTAGLYRRHDRGEVLRPNADVASRLLADFTAEVLATAPDSADRPVRQLVVSGMPQQRIAEVARLTGADLVIVGGQSGKPLLGRLLGRNTALAVLRRAHCQVLVVDGAGNTLDARDLRQGGQQRSLPPAMQTH